MPMAEILNVKMKLESESWNSVFWVVKQTSEASIYFEPENVSVLELLSPVIVTV